jgi:sugar lactone lactonase YvrE
MKNSLRLALCALAVLIFGSVSLDAQNITTIVGGGPVNLPATGSSVGSPVAVRIDTLGNTYVLDNTFGRVLKVDTTGVMSVYAGNGTLGFSGDGGLATKAQLNAPSGMCIDAANNLFIADSDNAVIREVLASDGTIHTVVGVPTSTNPVYGGDTGLATAAHLHFPDGCAFDTNGNMYIADRANNEIRVVIAGPTPVAPIGVPTPVAVGHIYRFAGGANGNDGTQTPPTGGYGADGTAAFTAPIYGPFDVFVDPSNNVFFTDLGNNFDANGTPDKQPGQPQNNNVVRMISATTGFIQTVAGSVGLYGADNNVAAVGAKINEPKGLSMDPAGNLYFADAVNQVIRKISGGNISVVAGTILAKGFSGDTHPATSATLTFPAGSFIAANGVLYIADVGSNALRIVSLLTNDGPFLQGNIYTIAGNGKLSYGGDTAAATSGELNTPAGLAVDGTNNIMIADSGSDLIRKVSNATPGVLSTIAGAPENNGFLVTPAIINNAMGVATDASGNVYIADTTNCLVRKISTAGGVTTVAGVAPAVPDPDNSANAPVCGFTAAGTAAIGTKLGLINSVALDSKGNVFFSDSTNNVVWEVPATSVPGLTAGNAYIFAGTPSTTGAFGGDNGAANLAQLSSPMGIYIDIYDNVFIADAGNHRIREVPAINIGSMVPGSIYTIAGNGTSGTTGDNGPATSAELQFPYAIVVDHGENVFFSDTTRTLTPNPTSTQTIREIAGPHTTGKTPGDIYTVVGTLNAAGFSGDGAAATAAHLDLPLGLALQKTTPPGATANLLVSDSVNNRVRSVAGIANIAPVALASLSPNPLIFTAEPVGTLSAASAITLTNAGGAALTVTGVTIGGTNAGDYAETDNCVGTVAASATCTINVTFKPGALGASTATLTVADSAIGGTQSVALQGTGGSPTADLNPTTLTFTGTTVNTMSAAQTVTLTNNGNVPTLVTAITITGANAGDFATTNTCGAAGGILPTMNCTISVTFKPTATGARTATLNIADNVGVGTQMVALTGTGGAATLSLTVKDTDPSSTQTVSAGATATYNLSVTANNATTVTITCTGAPTAAVCTPAPASVMLTASTAGTFKVGVTTTARGSIVPFHQPNTKMQPPSVMQLVPMASLAVLFAIVMMFSWMQKPASRMRTLRVALSVCLILMPIAAATMLVGCGGSSSTSPPPATGTPAGSYTLTVTATSGSTTASTTVTLVVN